MSLSRVTIDRFAEELAERGDVHMAAMAMGISSQSGKNMLVQIRKDLGWQAK